MRTFAIGDIHGCSIAFDALIDAISPQPEDKIITLGDYINKGPDAKGVLTRLIALNQTDRLTALRGNHELKMLAARSGQDLGPDIGPLLDQHTLASYGDGKRLGQLSDIPDDHWHFVSHTCVDWWETEHHFFVHATAHSNKPIANQPQSKLFWQKFDYPAPHCSGKTMICGHTSQKSGKPINIGHAICIDTWAYGEGWLTGLDVISGKVWQTNQKGQVQTTWIDQFWAPAASPLMRSLKRSRLKH